jgi:uncharacterized membrane protein YjgN (DUF898 family)
MHLPPDISLAPARLRDTPPALEILTPTFTGSGGEYFRIWIVNLLLTLATLGVYSAWAKVRRLQYFDRNTMLAGATFDFGGAPGAILKGRVLAVLLLVAYNYAIGLSQAVGLGVALALLLALPWLMRGALRYRLCNTSYRGLPFGFCGGVAGAYRAYLPPVATVLLPGALYALDPDSPLAALPFVLYLAWPLMHGEMKRYQHAHVTYGNRRAVYEVAPQRFFRPYAAAGLWFGAGLVAAGLALGALLAAWSSWGGGGIGSLSPAAAMLVFGAPAYLLFLLTGPYLQVRLSNLAWSGTSFEGLSIRCAMKARVFTRLQLANALLTVLTLGLYRPFAVVRVYRYRLACLALQVIDDFEAISAGSRRARQGATGDGAADFVGLDLSW